MAIGMTTIGMTMTISTLTDYKTKGYMTKTCYEAPQVLILKMETEGLVMAESVNDTISKPSDYLSGGDGFVF